MAMQNDYDARELYAFLGSWLNTMPRPPKAIISWVLAISARHRGDSERRLPDAEIRLCDTEFMPPSADPKSVKVNLTTGTGMDIDWKDGHSSHYTFVFLRDACPCALCDEERGKSRRQPGEPPKAAPRSLPMFKAAPKPTSVEGVGKYAIRFHWNDGHDLGIYSWQFLRDWCPCAECKAARAPVKAG